MQVLIVLWKSPLAGPLLRLGLEKPRSINALTAFFDPGSGTKRPFQALPCGPKNLGKPMAWLRFSGPWRRLQSHRVSAFQAPGEPFPEWGVFELHFSADTVGTVDTRTDRGTRTPPRAPEGGSLIRAR